MTKPVNIVYVFADQLRAHALGCYGNDFVPTPNLDAMAENGMLLDNCISSFPVCSPYRAMLLSGRYPIHNGTINNDYPLRDDIPTIGKSFKEQGYETGYIGKWHLEDNRDPFVPKERRMGFDYWAVHNCTHQYMDNFYCTDSPEPIHFKGYDALVYTDLAIDYIKENKENPFCLVLSWGPPHDPYNLVPDEYKARVPLDSIKLRDNVQEREIVDDLLARDEPPEEILDFRERRRAILEDDERLKKECLQGYYAHVCALDDCVGKLRDCLQDTGLAENTVFIFSSDHGDMLGSHRMALKQCPLEESLRVPMIAECPGTIPQGAKTDALLAPIDIMPTLLSLAGCSCPQVDGKDLSGVIKGEGEDAQDAVLIMKLGGRGNGLGGGPYRVNAMVPWRGVRTKRYTYAVRMQEEPWLLFDNVDDPFQMNNLVNHPDHAELQAKLHKRMLILMDEASDPGDTDKVKAAMEAAK